MDSDARDFAEQDDLYIQLKTWQRQLEFLEIQVRTFAEAHNRDKLPFACVFCRGTLNQLQHAPRE